MDRLNLLAAAIHKENMKWWVDLETGKPITPPRGQKEMLMISEVAEAMEGLRKDLMDDKLPHRKMAEVEVADYVIRVLDYAAAHKCDLSVEVPKQDRADLNDTELLLNMCANAFALYLCTQDGMEMSLYARVCIDAAEAFCDRLGYDLWTAVDEKRAFNRERPDHKIENRKAEGGKKW